MKLKTHELCVLSLFGSIMFLSKLLMEALPNIHLIAMFIVLVTLLFRWKALVAVYTFVFLTGIYGGFSAWWIPYLYIWALLWGAAMLIPKNMSRTVTAVVCTVVCGLHGFLFGILWAPSQIPLCGLSLKEMWLWILVGLPSDIVHGISNVCASLLIIPLYIPLKKALNRAN